MTVDRAIGLLVTVTLVVMMFTVGLGVTLADLGSAIRNGRRLALVTFANYVIVPAATVGLLIVIRPQPMVAVGFLILAACPGAPFCPLLSTIARGDAALSIGLMVLLAGSSAIVAPLLLPALIPLVSEIEGLRVNPTRMLATLVATQLAPLCLGLSLRRWLPHQADRLHPFANVVTQVLNLTAVVLILATQFALFASIRPIGFVGMFALLAVSLTAGYVLGGPGETQRRTVSLATALRNAGVGLVIAADSFPGTPVLSAVLAYTILEVLGSLGVALWWRQRRCMLEPVKNAF